MTNIAIILLAVLLGAVAGAGISGAAVHIRNLERRVKELEGIVETDRTPQIRWSHGQLDQIERLKFLLGRHLAERKVADEFLKNMYHELGEFYDAGPHGKNSPSRRREFPE